MGVTLTLSAALLDWGRAVAGHDMRERLVPSHTHILAERSYRRARESLMDAILRREAAVRRLGEVEDRMASLVEQRMASMSAVQTDR
jgi:hypothetical protein